MTSNIFRSTNWSFSCSFDTQAHHSSSNRERSLRALTHRTHTMRLTAVLPIFLGTTLTQAQARSWFDSGSSQSVLDEEPHAVPGDNPLIYCASPDDYILDIESVDLKPNPPEACVRPNPTRHDPIADERLRMHSGKNLTITASGTLSQSVDEGAKVHLQVKYLQGSYGIPILNQEVELCDYAGQIELKCPLKKGALEFEKIVSLPGTIPPVSGESGQSSHIRGGV